MELRSGIRADRAAGRAERAQREGGFTLLEVIVALTVLAFGMLGLAAMQLYAMSAGREGKHVVAASLAAQDHLEQVQYQPFATLGDTGGAWQNVGTVTNDVQGNSSTVTEMTYTIAERITDINPDRKAVDVRITWSEPERPNRQMVMSTVRFNY